MSLFCYIRVTSAALLTMLFKLYLWKIYNRLSLKYNVHHTVIRVSAFLSALCTIYM